MDNHEKEQYLREYATLKTQGKSFYPYAVLKDSIMAVIVMGVIIFLALLLGAELGPKADATTTSFVPRPEWYFFFLFELLRVVKPPALVFMATIGIPTICLILLILLPFFDRSAERNPLKRPIATLAGITTMGAMAYLTLLGALAGSPNEIDLKVAPQYEAGKDVAAQSGCLACHQIGENGNTGPGPNLSTLAERLPRQAIARTLVNPTSPMPSYQQLRDEEPEKFNELVGFLSTLRESE
ncbi:MAG: c-type cytochrome [Thermoleophilaceae bacterium]|nr:c-type cytochrome [Thermoleophilaceae bacterium]